LDNIISFFTNHRTEVIIAAVAVILIIFVILLLFRLLRKTRSKSEKKEMNTDKINQQPAMGTPQPGETFGLRLVDENGNVKILEKLPVSIGRDRQNEVVLKDTTVSANHARIYYDEAAGLVCIEDLGSLNGLYINGQPTRKNVLQDGVKIMVGKITLTFQDTGYIHPGPN
jgi:pSer/pThr/pTyr-binding forkhead associated (FHA) protein